MWSWKSIKRTCKKVDRQVKTYCVYDEATFEQVVEASKEWSHEEARG